MYKEIPSEINKHGTRAPTATGHEKSPEILHETGFGTEDAPRYGHVSSRESNDDVSLGGIVFCRIVDK